MGHEIRKHGIMQWKKMNEAAGALLRQLDADFQPTARMGALSVAQQQMVEIAKALSTNARIIIMDEPTAALTKNESEELYRITEKLRDDGKSVIFISHRLASTRFCDRILFIADGGIAEEGTHKELLAKGGAYAELFAVQSRYYQEGGMQDEEES